MHGHCESYGGRWAAGRHRRGRFGGYGFGGRHGMGGEMGPEDLRAGRMLAQGDLRLIALALIDKSRATAMKSSSSSKRRRRTGTARARASSIRR